jgi:dUTP pyrophosphatase
MIKQIRLINGAKAPEYATEGSAGMDFFAFQFHKLFDPRRESAITEFKESDGTLANSVELNPDARILIGTGVRIFLEEGYELQIRSRSGLAINKGVVVLNSPGTIDSDYEGEIGVILVNTSKWPVTITLGDKIAQGVLAKFESVTILPTITLAMQAELKAAEEAKPKRGRKKKEKVAKKGTWGGKRVRGQKRGEGGFGSTDQATAVLEDTIVSAVISTFELVDDVEPETVGNPNVTDTLELLDDTLQSTTGQEVLDEDYETTDKSEGQAN